MVNIVSRGNIWTVVEVPLRLRWPMETEHAKYSFNRRRGRNVAHEALNGRAPFLGCPHRVHAGGNDCCGRGQRLRGAPVRHGVTHRSHFRQQRDHPSCTWPPRSLFERGRIKSARAPCFSPQSALLLLPLCPKS